MAETLISTDNFFATEEFLDDFLETNSDVEEETSSPEYILQQQDAHTDREATKYDLETIKGIDFSTIQVPQKGAFLQDELENKTYLSWFTAEDEEDKEDSNDEFDIYQYLDEAAPFSLLETLEKSFDDASSEESSSTAQSPETLMANAGFSFDRNFLEPTIAPTSDKILLSNVLELEETSPFLVVQEFLVPAQHQHNEPLYASLTTPQPQVEEESKAAQELELLTTTVSNRKRKMEDREVCSSTHKKKRHNSQLDPKLKLKKLLMYDRRFSKNRHGTLFQHEEIVFTSNNRDCDTENNTGDEDVDILC